MCIRDRRLAERVREVVGMEAGSLVIGTFSSVATHVLPDAIGRFQACLLYTSASVLTAFELSVVTLVAISLTMGFYTAVSSLFFSGDIAFYLALPVGGTTIVWAKLANYMAGMMVVDLAMLPLSLGVLAGRGEGPLTWVIVVLAFLLCCVAVNVALVLVALPIVRFSKLVADKDRFARVFGLVSTVFALVIVVVATMGAYDGADGIDAAAAASMVGGIASAPVARVAFCLLCPPLAPVSYTHLLRHRRPGQRRVRRPRREVPGARAQGGRERRLWRVRPRRGPSGQVRPRRRRRRAPGPGLPGQVDVTKGQSLCQLLAGRRLCAFGPPVLLAACVTCGSGRLVGLTTREPRRRREDHG